MLLGLPEFIDWSSLRRVLDPSRAARLHPAPVAISAPAPRPREAGVALVEFAILLPVLLVLIFGIIDFGFAFNSQLEIRSAAREGARLATVDNGCSPSAPTSAVPCADGASQLSNLLKATQGRANGLADPRAITITVCYPVDNTTMPKRPAVGTDNVVVTISYPLRSVTGAFGPILNSKVVTATAVMRLEQAPTFDRNSTAC
jgi:hypothetical protein